MLRLSTRIIYIHTHLYTPRPQPIPREECTILAILFSDVCLLVCVEYPRMHYPTLHSFALYPAYVTPFSTFSFTFHYHTQPFVYLLVSFIHFSLIIRNFFSTFSFLSYGCPPTYEFIPFVLPHYIHSLFPTYITLFYLLTSFIRSSPNILYPLLPYHFIHLLFSQHT